MKSKIEFRILMEKINNFFVLPGTVRSLRIFEENMKSFQRFLELLCTNNSSLQGFSHLVVVFGRRISKLGKALKWKIYNFIGFSAQVKMLRVSFSKRNFSFRIHQPSEGSSVWFFLRNGLWATSFVAQKAARCQHFLAVVQCLFLNNLEWNVQAC